MANGIARGLRLGGVFRGREAALNRQLETRRTDIAERQGDRRLDLQEMQLQGLERGRDLNFQIQQAQIAKEGVKNALAEIAKEMSIAKASNPELTPEQLMQTIGETWAPVLEQLSTHALNPPGTGRALIEQLTRTALTPEQIGLMEGRQTGAAALASAPGEASREGQIAWAKAAAKFPFESSLRRISASGGGGGAGGIKFGPPVTMVKVENGRVVDVAPLDPKRDGAEFRRLQGLGYLNATGNQALQQMIGDSLGSKARSNLVQMFASSQNLMGELNRLEEQLGDENVFTAFSGGLITNLEAAVGQVKEVGRMMGITQDPGVMNPGLYREELERLESTALSLLGKRAMSTSAFMANNLNAGFLIAQAQNPSSPVTEQDMRNGLKTLGANAGSRGSAAANIGEAKRRTLANINNYVNSVNFVNNTDFQLPPGLQAGQQTAPAQIAPEQGTGLSAQDQLDIIEMRSRRGEPIEQSRLDQLAIDDPKAFNAFIQRLERETQTEAAAAESAAAQ